MCTKRKFSGTIDANACCGEGELPHSVSFPSSQPVMPKKSTIVVRGARANNLKGVDVEIPRDSFTVITGLSGSGKSSLAFDTIHAEANRRYMESVSSYARRFMEAFDRPDVDAITNLSPSISIDQKTVSRSPRSTVGTLTDIYDYVRVLFATAGKPHCPKCQKPLGRTETRDIVQELLLLPDGTRLMFLSKLDQTRKKTEQEALRVVEQAGYARVRFHGQVMTVDEAAPHASDMILAEIETVIDRVIVESKRPDRERLMDSVETAFKQGHGVLTVAINDAEERRYSSEYVCDLCDIRLSEWSPQTFSFNSPEGACSACTGLGVCREIDPDLVVPNRKLSLSEGAIRPWSKSPSACSARLGNEDSEESFSGHNGNGSGRRDSAGNGFELLKAFARRQKIRLDVPVSKMKKSDWKMVLFGEDASSGSRSERFQGVIPLLMAKYRETKSEHIRTELEKYMVSATCPACSGKRLRPEALAARFDGRSIDDLVELPSSDLLQYMADLEAKRIVVASDDVLVPVIREIRERLESIDRVGLGYLSLSRGAETLSGGEAQRVKLATQMKSGLSGILYVLDEPSVGLHSRDTERLIAALRALREKNNSLIVVEHDSSVLMAADWIVDMGPGAGREGGEVIFSGRAEALSKAKTLTGLYLTGKRTVSERKTIRTGKKFLSVLGAKEHNLKSVDAHIPLGVFCVVSGVSGSGKSTLVTDILSRALARTFFGARAVPGKCRSISGMEHIDKAIMVDQDPIGRTPRSNAATYTCAFSPIRDLFAETPEAVKAGFSASHFSFNMRGGRCEMCQGGGVRKIEMYLLPDRYVPCEACHGARYNEKTLAIEYRGRNISEVLDMTVSEARAFFFDQQVIEEKLRALDEVGLGYLVLGQSATELSGGEAQRVKLATELARKSTGKTLYILDEPTIGLHFEDIRRLLLVLDALVDKGNTVLVVEHNTDVIRHADWVIDMGPDGGALGGEIVFAGTPKDLKKCKRSITGKYL